MDGIGICLLLAGLLLAAASIQGVVSPDKHMQMMLTGNLPPLAGSAGEGRPRRQLATLHFAWSTVCVQIATLVLLSAFLLPCLKMVQFLLVVCMTILVLGMRLTGVFGTVYRQMGVSSQGNTFLGVIGALSLCAFVVHWQRQGESDPDFVIEVAKGIEPLAYTAIGASVVLCLASMPAVYEPSSALEVTIAKEKLPTEKFDLVKCEEYVRLMSAASTLHHAGMALAILTADYSDRNKTIQVFCSLFVCYNLAQAAFCVYLVLNRDVLGFMVPPALGLLFFYAFTAGAVAIGMFFV